MQNHLADIVRSFTISGEVKTVEKYGSGHINVTYLVTCENKRYILQKMNTRVFSDPDALMHNIVAVTSFLQAQGIETLRVVPTLRGASFLKGEDCYRMYDFIEGAVSYDQVTDESIFMRAGQAFGAFQNALSSFDASQLTETIKRFHDTPERFRQLQAAIDADSKHRLDGCKAEADFFLRRCDTFSKAVDGLKDGSIPLRVTHNDTKLNNILMDAKSGEARAIIDLDTVMPGSLLYDFGDSIRFGASTAAEDEKDLSKVHFHPGYFTAYANGFLGAVKKRITKAEVSLLPYSAYLLTAECGMRFLTDYLQGDTYFATKYEGHNLVRARTQIRLAEEMESSFGTMEKAVSNAMQ